MYFLRRCCETKSRPGFTLLNLLCISTLIWILRAPFYIYKYVEHPVANILLYTVSMTKRL